jgi:ATP-dependent helicase HrpB
VKGRFVTNLPVAEVFRELQQALSSYGCAVLQAPPGAGKTTAVPLALLEAPWLGGLKLYLLAPRRLAARSAARRMARMLGESVGETVGYRVRLDTRVGPKTRIEVMTEGVLTRLLQRDPSLKGIGLVIFDEFHERSLEADLGLALCLDIQGVLSVDLRLLVMSATMETGPLSALLGGAPVIETQGRAYPVETRYIGKHTPSGSMADVSRAILTAARDGRGSVLVFLPGAAEIRTVARRLGAAGLDDRWQVSPLLGSLSSAEQDRAIAPAPAGRRKIVLATSIAETSLTIEGIHVVVDCGLQRIPRFDVRSGMTRLVTVPVSRASADQRRGRAGRLGPGLCLRLWSEAAGLSLVPGRRPEILETDLCRLALELARWGVRHPGDLKWLDPPPEAAYSVACTLLRELGALDQRQAMTPHGRAMAAMPVHPRLGHMLLMGQDTGQGPAACDLAALLTERDPIRFEAGHHDVDMQIRFDALQARRSGRALRHPYARVNGKACDRILAAAGQLHRLLAPGKTEKRQPPLSLGRLLAWAYPDRIARRRPDERGRYVMVGGQGVRLEGSQPMAAEDFIVAAEVDGKRRDGRIFRAAAYGQEMLEEQFEDQLQWRDTVRWDRRSQSVAARRQRAMGAIILQSQTLEQPDGEQVCAALIEGITLNGIAVLPWNKSLRQWQMRVCFLHHLYREENRWPDVSDAGLARRLDQWLKPYLAGIRRLRDVAKVDLRGALLGQLSHDQHRDLDRLAPTHWTVPSGSRIPIDYTGQVPILAVRLQEMFGMAVSPAVAGGRQRLLIHLLSPAGRPVQVTQDLSGFWKTGYHEVKKELKGRYPKHYWPDDPLTARATARVKPRK